MLSGDGMQSGGGASTMQLVAICILAGSLATAGTACSGRRLGDGRLLEGAAGRHGLVGLATATGQECGARVRTTRSDRLRKRPTTVIESVSDTP